MPSHRESEERAMRFILLAVAFLAAAPLLSKLIAVPPADGSRELSPQDCVSPGFTLKNIKEILLDVYLGMGEHRIGLLAAGVAFYALFAIFPALGAATWIFGLLANPADIHSQLESWRDVLPAEAWQIIDRQLAALTSHSTSLSIAGIFSLLVALYSARLAASSMMEALNAVFGVQERRGFIVTNAVAILFTLVAIAILFIAVGVLVGVPIFFSYVGLSSVSADIAGYSRWPALAVMMALALAVTYRFGPDRQKPCWKWLTWGSATATALWLIASYGFSWYVSTFNSYDKVYGSIGAAVILLFWFWITSFSGLLGAELDSAIERRAGVLSDGPNLPKLQAKA